MKRFLFLIGFAEGSDSAGGKKTNIHQMADLYSQWLANNKNVFGVEIRADREETALVYGHAQAWAHQITMEDSVSDCVLLDDSHQHNRNLQVVWAHPQTDILLKQGI